MKTKIILGLLGMLGLLGFLGHAWVVGGAVWGDGRFYYQYLPSLVINGNLGSANKFAIGPALFWLPVFAIVHAIIRGTGYEFGYQLAVGLTSVIFGFIGLIFCYLTARKYFSPKISLMAVVSIWLATNLFFYLVLDPINSHAISFFVASLVVYFWMGEDMALGKLMILGVLAGILGMVRSQDLIFALPLLFWARKSKNIWLLATGIIVGFLPQLAVWKIQFGTFKSPYLLAGEKFIWLRLQVWEVLFSRNNGLFYYSPILILGLLGILGRLGKNFWAKTGMALFILELLIVSFWHNWWGGQAYGGRMFISLMPFFILGLAGMLEKLKKIKILTSLLTSLMVLILIINNFYMMAKFLITNP